MESADVRLCIYACMRTTRHDDAERHARDLAPAGTAHVCMRLHAGAARGVLVAGPAGRCAAYAGRRDVRMHIRCSNRVNITTSPVPVYSAPAMAMASARSGLTWLATRTARWLLCRALCIRVRARVRCV